MALLTARSSTIFIATRDKMRIYRSVEEIPPRLRRKLQETTHSLNSATILIADKRGREELIRALEAQSAETRKRSEAVCSKTPAERQSQRKRLDLRSIRTWIELLLPAAIGASLWFFIESRF